MVNLRYDSPITEESQDLLSRNRLVTFCAQTLSSINNDSSFVIGLSGPWGSGKTSFINLLQARLVSSGDQLTVIRFNPWNYTTYEQLLRDFFSELKEALGMSKIRGTLGQAITDYADSIATLGTLALYANPRVAAISVAIPAVKDTGKNVFKRMIEKLGSTVRGEKTLAQSRDALTKELAKLEKNVVIMMDDIDRLSSEEICMVFKLVTLTASFPHLTYVLAYDLDVVTNSLASVQGIDGALYLEKIVQLPIELPPPPQSLLDNHLQQQLMSFIDMFPTHRIEGEERSRLATVYQSLVLPNITTPRKLKRYLNKLNVTVQVLGEEICPTDVFGMVVLALFYKNTYEWIWKNRLELCDEALHFNREDNTWKIKLAESLSSAIDLDHSNVEMTVKGIGALYPAAARWSRPNVLVTRKISRETGRIASIDNTEYFYGSIEVGSITRQSLERLVFADNGDELGNGLMRLEQTDEMDRALDYIEVNRARLSIERKEQVAGQMLKVVGSISQDDDVSFFQTPHPRKFARIICSLLTDLGIKRSDAIVLNAVDGFTTLDYVGLTWFLRDERNRQNKQDNDRPVLSTHAYETVSTRYLDAIVAGFPIVLCMPHHPAKFFWRAIDADLGTCRIGEVRSRFGNNVKIRCVGAASELERWTSGNTQRYTPPNETGGNSYDALFDAVTRDDLDRFALTATFAQLPEDVQIRVASLYVLLGLDQSHGESVYERTVTEDEAIGQLTQWRNR